MPNLFIIVLTILVSSLVLHRSGKSEERKSRAKIAKMDPQPAHYWIDNQPTLGAWAIVIIIAIIGTTLAMPR